MLKPKKNIWLKALFIIAIIFVAFYVHITNGMFDMTVPEVLKTIFGLESNPKFELVIFEFRLPRIIIALLVGIGLAIAGSVLQGITKNDLADPGILGINAGAGAAVSFFMLFFQFNASRADGSQLLNIMMMPIFGLVGGVLAAAIIFVFAYKNGRLDVERLLLTGIAINTGFGALALYITLKMSERDFEMAALWQTGTIYNANWAFIIAMLPWIVLLGIYIYRKKHLLDYFQLEESTIVSLGISIEKEKIKLLLASVGIVSACVSVSGSIGFIGLMAPHIARQLVGVHHKYVVPFSALIGAALLLISDFIAKTIFAPSELAVGVVVSIIGIPYFLYLLIKAR